ncbi:MAG: PA domain-containing protein [Bryobacterales bacterium]|nr:PA domain-containing protein [Bryobacterales bacterium]
MSNKFLTLVLMLGLTMGLFGQATVQVFNADAPGEGFNDPTPAAPVGGNPGTTIGQQRQIAFGYTAFLWGQQLSSTQTIKVLAFFDPLGCTPTAATLGAAAPFWSFANRPAAPGFPGLLSNTFYPAALAEKRTGVDITAQFPGNDFELFAFFNSNLGNPGCLDGAGWYYGLDNNPPPGKTNLVAVLLHEFGHGLGFTVGPTNANTGVRAAGIPSIWELSMKDLSTGKTWFTMTDIERAASARNTNSLVWTGPSATAAAQQVLAPTPELVISGPRSVRGQYEAQSASFGLPLSFTGLKDVLVPGFDGVGVSTDGCEPLLTNGPNSVAGRVALIDRGGCTFTQKVKNAQDAGAIAVVIANNAPAGLPGMGGTDPSIIIPSIGVTQAVGQALRALPQLSNPGRGGLPVELRLSAVFRSGLSGGFPRLYAPNPFQQGSSVSHWDITLTPNQLMEPFINLDLTQSLQPPQDLTFPLFQDIGW